MRVLHVYNRHRGGGGSDNAWDATIRLSREQGFDVQTFERDSRSLPPGLGGRVSAFCSGLYAPEAVRGFARALEEFRPDLVHAHELYPLISPWILPACSRLGIPAVLTCYDYRLTCPVATHFHKGRVCEACKGGREYQAVLRNCRDNYAESLAYGLRNASARAFGLFRRHVSQFIVLTDFSRRWLRDEVGIEDARITVNACSIPLPATAADPAAGGYIAYAGRFVEEKGVELLIEAARRTGLPVKLAGNAPTHPALRAGDPVECVLTRSPEELAAFYRGARMLAVPSIWYETFGIVAAEAMSHGIPVIASRFGALQDTVRDGVSGLLFEMRSVEDLCEKITMLWHDADLCRALGAGGREQVRTRFNRELHFRRLTDAYRKARRLPVEPEIAEDYAG